MKLTLKALRNNKGYTQEEASKLIGISVETLAKYEKGVTYPDIPILKKIEEVYDVNYDNINFFIEKKRLNRKNKVIINKNRNATTTHKERK